MGLGINVVANGASQSGEYNNPGQVLDGSATATNSTAPVTIITVPATRTWVGTLSVSGTNTTGTGSQATATVNTAGAGVIPAAAVNLIRLHVSTVGTTAGLASQNNQTSDVIVVAPAANPVTLTLTNSTGTTFTSDASAVGILL